MKKQRSKKKKGGFRKSAPTYPQTLPQGSRDRLIGLGEEIHKLTEARRYDEAERLCKSGLELIPKPREAYIETTWYLSALGEIYFLQEQYSQARDQYEKVRLILERAGESDPFTMLRLGEIALETGDEETAMRYLSEAYNAEGSEIFDGQDVKYYDFLKTRVDINDE